MNDQIHKKLLQEEIKLLQKSLETLQLSVEKCIKIGQKDAYSFEEMESFDSLTSKFGRTADIYTQKVIRTSWMLLHEPFLPFIDLLHNAEKINLVHSTESLIEIRDLRNQITHEYIPEAITGLVPEVIELTRLLKQNIDETDRFLIQHRWIADDTSF